MGFDAIVIGGGVVGSSVAYHLVSGGAKTLLIDRCDPGRATDAGAGIISPDTNTRDPDPWYRFAAKAGAYYPTLVTNLEAESQTETGFAVCGLLRVVERVRGTARNPDPGEASAGPNRPPGSEGDGYEQLADRQRASRPLYGSLA